MILATLREGGRDGTLLVVDRDRRNGVRAAGIAATLQAAVDDWDAVAPKLERLSAKLNAGSAEGSFELDLDKLMAPLPRAYAYFDAGCYPEHMRPIREARGAPFPPDFFEKPMMYEGCSGPIYGPTEPMRLPEDDAWGVDLEAELAVIIGDVPAGVRREDAAACIRLICLYNDYSLRTLGPPELARGFGFLQSKPASSMGPFAITPDEAGSLWTGDFMGGRYMVHVRGERIGALDTAKDAVYTYSDLIVHASKTRPLLAGSLVAAGTIGNTDRSNGCGCIAELRAREQLTTGKAKTPYLRFGDEVRLELLDHEGRSVFGAIRQRLKRAEPSPTARSHSTRTDHHPSSPAHAGQEQPMSKTASTAKPPRLVPAMLNHAAWVTKDMAATADFYTRILGMEIANCMIDSRIPSTGDPFPHFHLFFKMKDGSTVAFFEAPGLPPEPPLSHPAYGIFNHFAMQADSVEEVMAWREWLLQNGVEVLGPTDHKGAIYSIYFHDPNGIRMEITAPQTPEWNMHADKGRQALDEWEAAKKQAREEGADLTEAMFALSERLRTKY